MINILLGLMTAYVIGSIPTSYLIGKYRGIDVRKEGSGNAGATNVLRTVGKLPALITLIIDILKGVIAVTLIYTLFFRADMPIGDLAFKMLLGLGAVSGHVWSVFLRFKGGRGVATSLGVVAVVLPRATAIAVLVFLLTLWLTKYVSLGSILMSITIPIVAAFSGRNAELVLLAVTLCILTTYRHRDNIKRLLNGTEGTIGNYHNG